MELPAISTLIVDDEQGANDNLKKKIERFCPELTIVKQAFSVREGIIAIRKYHPLLVFLDIKLDDGLAFDLLEAFDERTFAVIIVTAFSKEYQEDMERYSLEDCLKKPADRKQLKAAVEKSKKLITHLLSRVKISLKTVDKSVYLFSLQEVIYCESDNKGKHSKFYILQKKEPIVSVKPIAFYKETLITWNFIETTKGYLVNISHIKEYTPGLNETAILTLSNGYLAHVSRYYKPYVLKRLNIKK